MASKEEIKKRISMLRAEMVNSGVNFFLAASTDPHISEYIGDHFKVTEYLSGCTSDNVTLVVEAETAHLWTDGRYFISAALELEDTGIILMRSGQPGIPTVRDYLKEHLSRDDVLAYDGTCVRASEGRLLRAAAKGCGASVESGEDLVDRIWLDRPALPVHPVRVLADDITGKSAADKLAVIRSKMEEAGVCHFVLSRMDDIMWLLNIRGNDVECCPVAMTHLLVGMQTADLFIQDGEVTEELLTFARDNRVKIHEYGTFLGYLKDYHFEGVVLCDSRCVSDAVYSILEERAELRDADNPTELLKAVKNDTEIANSKKYYLLDSVAVCRFIFRIKKETGSVRRNEWQAARLLDGLRKQIPGFLDLSFPTISAYNASAAMAHYSAGEHSSRDILPEGFLLVDSGGQYLGATTDVTRTIALGPLTDEMKRDFTLVAAANLSLMYTRFAKGTTGCQLDIIARERLYRYGCDFNHGTGHGVGYILNVHEGPQRISHTPKERPDAEFVPGMITSDEPGIYREGKYGIRTESIVLCVPDMRNEFGEFYRFEPLTFVPIDLDAIDEEILEQVDRRRLNDYHRQVRENVAPFLEGEEREWLLDATREI